MAAPLRMHSMDALEYIKPQVNAAAQKWQKHMDFIDTECSSHDLVDVSDPATSLFAALESIVWATKLLNPRVEKLTQIGAVKHRIPVFTTIESVLALLGRPVGLESTTSMLHKGAANLQYGVHESLNACYVLEWEVKEKFQALERTVDQMIEEEERLPTSRCVQAIERIPALEELLAREPEDAVWTVQLRRYLDQSRRLVDLECLDVFLSLREEFRWDYLLMYAKIGVKVRLRQTLITGYFERIWDDDEDEEEAEEDAQSEGAGTEGAAD